MTTNLQAEEFEFGLIREWIDDGGIAVIHGQGNMARKAVDAWADLVLRTAHEFPEGQPVYLLHNLTHPDQGFTPYAKRKTEELYDYAPDVPIYSAIVLRNTIINRLISLFVQSISPRSRNVRQQVFISEEAALSWLRTMVSNPTE